MSKEYSEDFKRHVVNRYENSESILTLSQELGISQTPICRWRGEYCAVQAIDRVYTPKEIDLLLKHVKKLEETLEVIRASGFILEVPLGERLAFLEKPYRHKEGQVQIIGWLYQFYNSEFKDETFALLKKNVKVTKERIPSATQLFTPDWIVRYMVENPLGCLWLEGHPDETLLGEWTYFLDEAEQEPETAAQLAAFLAPVPQKAPKRNGDPAVCDTLLLAQVQFSEMDWLSSWAKENMMVTSTSPLPSKDQIFSFSK